MAVVLKRATASSKGVVVFTHKERAWVNLHAPVIGPELRELKRRYFVLMHWGWFMENQPSYGAVDLHLARESTLRFRAGVEDRRVALNSAMFTPRDFRPQSLKKQWDVISVTRSLKAKRTDELLECLRLVYDRRPETTAFVVCIAPPEPGAPNHHDDLLERYEKLFSTDERERFTFLFIRTLNAHPLSRRDIAFLYNSSRVFTLFSDREGASKAIKEALLCGLPVMVKGHLIGGGTDFLNDRNSRLFRTAAEGAQALIGMLDDPSSFSVDARDLAEELSEDANIPKLRRAVQELFERDGATFDGEIDTDNLSRKLPSHVNLLPAELRSRFTDDLRSGLAFLLFLRMLNRGLPLSEVSASPTERALLTAFDRTKGVRQRVDAALRKLGLAR